jgi:hypothetical protein
VLVVVEGRQRRRLRHRRHVERIAQLVQHHGDLGIAHRVAHAQRRQAVDLRERAQQHRARTGAHHRGGVGVVGAVDVFGVGLVEHDDDVRGHGGQKRAQLVVAKALARGVVGVRQEHQLDARIGLSRLGHRRQVVAQPRVERHRDLVTAQRPRRDAVADEARPGVQQRLARTQKRPRQQRDDLVGSVAQHHVLWRHVVHPRDALLQVEAVGVGIQV